MRSRNIVESFNYAIEGIIYAVKTQRNIKVHLIMAMLAMILAVVLNVTRVELLILMLTIGLVISTELINTAIEEVVNLAHEDPPLARVAKDVAAGAVLFSSVMAVGVGYIILFQRLIRFDLRQLMRGIAVENLGLWPCWLSSARSSCLKAPRGAQTTSREACPAATQPWPSAWLWPLCTAAAPLPHASDSRWRFWSPIPGCRAGFIRCGK